VQWLEGVKNGYAVNSLNTAQIIGLVHSFPAWCCSSSLQHLDKTKNVFTF